MSDVTDVTTNAPLDEVRGLVEERGRYEGWLSALDARRAVTPAHVLDRVRQDYDGRLRRVLDALDAHSGALRADEAGLASRHDEQLRTLGERRDQLAEVELRTLVGEYAPDEGERQRREVEGAIGELEGRLAGAASQLADVRGLLGHVTRDTARDGASATPAESQPAVAEPAPQATAASQSFAAPEPIPDDRLGLDAARAALGDADARGYAPNQNQYAPGIRTGAARSTPPFAGQSFADNAFRTPPTSMPAQQPGADAAMPMAGMGAGFGTPASGTGGVAQEKTLRCADCGAMNYPTEWYCEKCGGELAAL